MTDPRLISILDYSYDLPDAKIARFPLPERDSSKLLVCKNGQSIVSDTFSNIAEYIPVGSLVILNNTRVVRARMIFKKLSGAHIEIFCLEPVFPQTEIQLALELGSPVQWNCFVGNAKRWKTGILVQNIELNDALVELSVKKVGQSHPDGSMIVEFSWSDRTIPFSTVIGEFGIIPLPPYLHRSAVEEDNNRYQTIFAEPEGSVAAPTAGLHFTEQTFAALKKRNIITDFLTLHVGAGTFKPVTAEKIGDHSMHAEQVHLDLELIRKIAEGNYSKIIAVGTTSVRCLESFYWLGSMILNGYNFDGHFQLSQWAPYHSDYNQHLSAKESYGALLNWMNSRGVKHLSGHTSLIIAPPYKPRVVEGIITNFHQPQSTLLLLVSAFVGDRWREVYQYALQNDYRFLSYGDSCFFMND
jgi:S-adenosylmethionine:tRNA ribosyltransferase-isomerase